MSGPESPAGFGWLYTCICTDPTNYTSTEHALEECADSCAGIRIESCEDALSSQAMVCSEVKCGANFTTECILTPFPPCPFNWIALSALLLQLLALCLLYFSQRMRENESEEELLEELFDHAKAIKTNYKGRLSIRRRLRRNTRTRRSRIDPNPLSDSNNSIRPKSSLVIDAANQDGRWWWLRYTRAAWSTGASAASSSASAASSADIVATQSYPPPSKRRRSTPPKAVVVSNPRRRQSMYDTQKGSSNTTNARTEGTQTSSSIALASKQDRPPTAIQKRVTTEKTNDLRGQCRRGPLSRAPRQKRCRRIGRLHALHSKQTRGSDHTFRSKASRSGTGAKHMDLQGGLLE